MANIAKTLSESDGAKFLQSAFATEQECLRSALKASNRIAHDGDKGEVNEQHLIEALQSYLPDRYTVAKAIVLDSRGQTTDSIDIVVFDRQYTPTLLDNKKHRYVPAEAVYAVFECKPTINKSHLEYATDKAASVRRLHRTSVPIPHAGGTYQAKKHFEIIAGILAAEVEWVDGFKGKFLEHHVELVGDHRLDCGLAVSGACFDVFSPEGEYTFGPEDNSLVFFLFRFLQKLQSLGTVPAIDWNAYAQQLSK